MIDSFSHEPHLQNVTDRHSLTPRGAMSSRVVKETATRAVAAGSKKLSKTIVVSRAAKRRHAEVSYESNESPPATSKLKTERGAKEPPKWRQQLNNIRKMRENRDAPVDQEGAKALSDSSASPEVCVVCERVGVVSVSHLQHRFMRLCTREEKTV